VKKIITAVRITAIIISSVLLGAMSGAEEVNILNVSLSAPKETNVKIIASIFHLFMKVNLQTFRRKRGSINDCCSSHAMRADLLFAIHKIL
jgi:hypothetical protein